MIDVWLIFCLLIPLAEVLFHAVLDKYRDDRSKRLSTCIGCANLAPDARGIKPDAGSRNLRRTSLSGRHCMYRYEIELEEAELLPLARMDPAFALTPKERVKKKKAILSYLRILGMAGFPFFFIFFALIFFTIGFAL